MELIEDGDVLVREQAILDEFEDDTTQIAIATERLLSSCASASTSDSNSKKLWWPRSILRKPRATSRLCLSMIKFTVRVFAFPILLVTFRLLFLEHE